MTQHEQYREDLALYAVGALAAAESEEIKRHLAQCAECREELSALEDAAAQIALAIEPVMPPARLRGQVLTRLNEAPHPASAAHVAEPAVAAQPRPRSQWFWAPAFAVGALAVALIVLWGHDRRILQENQQLIGQLRAENSSLESAREVIDTLTAADAQHASLVATGTKLAPEAKTVYSPKQRNLVLLASNLPPLIPSKVYELWLLPANGAPPVAAGTFMPDSRGSATLLLSRFGDGAAAKAFAVTIENAPGSSTPTMPIVLLGTT